MASHIDPRDLVERRTVAGLFLHRARAEQEIDALKTTGFTGDQIGVALRDRTAQGVLLEDTGLQVAEEAATTGALGGGLLGGLTGLLIGIGALVIPGLGPVVAGGMLATAFGVAGGTAVAGAGIGAAAGGLLGALVLQWQLWWSDGSMIPSAYMKEASGYGCTNRPLTCSPRMCRWSQGGRRTCTILSAAWHPTLSAPSPGSG